MERKSGPDEYFFMEIFGSAMVEHLNTMLGARLCAWAEGHKMAVLPHYSPGYPEWDISQQGALMELLRRTRGSANGGNGKLPGQVEGDGVRDAAAHERNRCWRSSGSRITWNVCGG